MNETKSPPSFFELENISKVLEMDIITIEAEIDIRDRKITDLTREFNGLKERLLLTEMALSTTGKMIIGEK